MTEVTFQGGSQFYFSTAAARALMSVEDMTAKEVADRSMNVAADMCVHTNKEFLTFELEDSSQKEPKSSE